MRGECGMSIICNVMRWLVFLLIQVVLTAGCLRTGQPGPAGDAAGQQSPAGEQTEIEDQGDIAAGKPAVKYPQAALEYILGSLKQPATAGYPPLEQSWLAIARLNRLGTSDPAGAIADEVLAMVAAAEDAVLPQLAAAWLAVERQAAEDFIAARLAAGQLEYVNSLMYSPEAARQVLARMQLSQADPQMQLRVTRLLAQMRPLTAADLPLLQDLAVSNDRDVSLQAAGMLLAMNADAAEQRRRLWDAIRDQDSALGGAAEGIKLSRDQQLADALVPLAAAAAIGEEDPEAAKQRKVVFAAYALAYLPGEQAQLMRRKLLGAADPTVRWEARLGELLHGDASYWNGAVDKHGIDDSQLWLALEPHDATHADLLPTLLRAAKSEDPSIRLQAALHLNRYAADSSKPQVADALELLVADDVTEVSALAWYAAGWLQIGSFTAQAAALIGDGSQAPDVRLAAAYYAMKVAEARVEEVVQ